MNGIKGFIFDMDGVLTETSENHYLAWKDLASSIDIEIDSSINEKLKGVSRKDSLEVILRHGHKENMYSEEEKKEFTELKNNRYLEMINSFDENNLFPGVLELFKELKRRGIKIAIASASESAAKLVELMKIGSFIDFIADPRKVPGKPNPDIFIQAANGLELKPKECVGVEDAIAGIEAIKSAGMLAVGIGSREQLQDADLIYQQTGQLDIEEISKFFEGLEEQSND